MSLMRRLVVFCSLALFIVTSLALASVATVRKSSAAAGPKLPREALRVPIIPQATDYSCGAAALLGVLYYWQAYEGNESSLYPMLETTPEDGTEPNRIAEVAAALGLQASWKENMTLGELRRALDAGKTVILDIQAWTDVSKSGGTPWRDRWDDGHYVVLVAMDNVNGYFMDPSAGIGYGFIPIPELLDRWHDYEDRRGTVWKYYNLGIIISGDEPIQRFPGKVVRIE